MKVSKKLAVYNDSLHETSSGSRVPFGFKDGVMYEPRQVPLGNKCGCICPGCNRPLTAKHALKGLVTPHFAHQPGENCLYGRESAIHLAAKQLIEEHRKLYIPDLIVQVFVLDEMGYGHSPKKTLIPAGIKDFNMVRLEQSVSNFRPDIIATTINGNDLIVEIAVTHFVDDEKLERIKSYGCAAIEIDASRIADLNFEALRKLLFEASPNAKWLFHPREEPARLALIEQLKPTLESAKIKAMNQAEHLRKKAEELKRKMQLEADRQAKLEESKRKKIDEFKAMSVEEKLMFSLNHLGIDENMIPDFLDHKVRGEWSYGVPRRNWQLSVFGAFIQKHPKRKGNSFHLDRVVEWLSDRFVVKNNANYPNSYKVAVWDFLKNLSDLGILNSTGGQWFEIEQNDLKEIISSYKQKKIFLNIEYIDLSKFNLHWEDEWPERSYIAPIAYKYTQKFGTAELWSRLASLLPSAIEKPPHDIAMLYSSGKFNNIDVILKFMVEAKFVRLYDKNESPNN